MRSRARARALNVVAKFHANVFPRAFLLICRLAAVSRPHNV